LLDSSSDDYVVGMTEAMKTVADQSSRQIRVSKSKLVFNAGPAGGSKVKTYQFGSAKLTVSTSAQSEWAPNIDLGQSALKKLKRVLVKPGVKLRGSKAAPLFHADPANPRQLVRVLNGKRETGVFENGEFKATE